jgi:hypothetical protein
MKSGSDPSQRLGGADSKPKLEWIQPTTELISRLAKKIDETVEEWNSFDTPGGDIDYFESVIRSSARARASLNSIRKIMKTLVLNRKWLGDWEKNLNDQVGKVC